MTIELVGTRRIVVVDDHHTFSELLTVGLDSHADLTCVGTAHDAASALTLLRHTAADVVVMDVRIGDDDGLELSRLVLREWPDIAIILLTAFPTRTLMQAASKSGVSALLGKNGSLPDLLSTVLTAKRGQFTAPLSLLMSLHDEDRELHDVALTGRETEVLRHLSLGHEVRSISRDMNISVHTCRGYVKSLLAKLGAHSQLELVVLAQKRGILWPAARR